MELTDLPVFGLIRQRMSWLSQRQTVLSQNIANADTPEYRARDLKAFDFKDIVREHSPAAKGIAMASTNAGHLHGASNRAQGAFKETDVRRPYETAPDGNQIVLEEQMAKMNETNISHNLMTELYRKQLRMFRSVMGRGGGR